MTYHLLTGATGLLGSYLLRDSLREGHRLAVLVRPTKRESARRRIESILSRFEADLRTTLPRPVVFEGELAEVDLGLDGDDLRWISRHCRSVIHNAANLTFHSKGRDGEPWLSNLEGTRRVLDLCRTAGIRQLHYISTAYVCGLRQGRVLETELDVGQTPGNAYEHSKIEAEKLVLACPWIDPPTTYRPAIIVGDSQTGYTSTFHGFYVMVKLAHTLVSRMVLGSTAGHYMVEGLGLTGKECKNLVPVDWVSAVLTHIFSQKSLHGRTYHLVTRRPPSLTLIAKVIQHAVEEYSTLADEKDLLLCNGSWFLDNFRQQMEIYRAYWRDDPQFDDTNRAAAAPLECPEMDAEMLLNLARYAIQSNFGKTQRQRIRPDFDIHDHMHKLPRHHMPMVPNLWGNHCLGLDISGPAGGQWKLMLHNGRLTEVEDGLGPQCSAVFQLDADTFRALGDNDLAAAEAVRIGRVVIEGNGLDQALLAAILQAAAVRGIARIAEPSL
ncbi:MAG: SDR family oxidoreductase [Thermoguttaceae bacterium]|jgi:nucleoside-diphosphate-sugar epimerase